TITMQVSKQTQTSTEDEGLKGIVRKFTDIYMSVFKIETRYTKEEILEFYLNYNNLGGNIKGVQQASLSYFGKNASELNVAESAMIAGLFQSPNGYSPYLHPKECEERRKTVLSLMLRHGYINQEEFEIASLLSVDKLLIEDKADALNQGLIDTVVAEVISRTKKDPYEGSMKIYTTFDKAMQDNMNDIMDGKSYKWVNDAVQAGSVILDVKTGGVTAVGAGRNRKVANGQNYATMIKRQIGSTAKPLYDYGPGIEYNNWSTYTGFVDEPYTYSDGNKMNNWDNRFFGFMTLHDALKESRNVPALKAFQKIKNSNSKNFATGLGLSPEISNGMIHEAHSIGGYNGESPLTLAAAYAAFSNNGYYIEPHSFTKIEYSDGESFEVKPITRKAMSDQTAYMITKVLEDTSSSAIGVYINGVNYCGKTGTTNYDNATIVANELPWNAISDKWIASYNEDYAITVWYGYDKIDKKNYLSSSSVAQKYIFQAIAKSAYTKKSNWDQPNSVVKVEVEKNFPEALLPSEFTPASEKTYAYFKKGFEPTEKSERYSQLADVSNLNYDDKTHTLNWDKIKTPKFIDKDYLSQLYSPMFSNETYRTNFLNDRNTYNNANIGNVVYDIYTKDSSGKLTLISSTIDNKLVHKIDATTTFVVKTSYSIFKANASKGTEFTIDKIPTKAIYSCEINGDSIIKLNIGTPFKEPTKPVIVFENSTIDITNKATITYSIMRNSDKKLFTDLSSIDTSIIESYTITYNIVYNEYHNTLTKQIEIK
ncbi:MAG: transglycosylase domain-containing protein, partial [Bacilli bacterium]